MRRKRWRLPLRALFCRFGFVLGLRRNDYAPIETRIGILGVNWPWAYEIGVLHHVFQFVTSL